MRQRTLTFSCVKFAVAWTKSQDSEGSRSSMDAGNPLKSVEIVRLIEQPIYEVSIFLNALSMTLRSTKKTEEPRGSVLPAQETLSSQ